MLVIPLIFICRHRKGNPIIDAHMWLCALRWREGETYLVVVIWECQPCSIAFGQAVVCGIECGVFGSNPNLAAGTIGRARAWILAGAESAPDYSRIMRAEGHMPLATAEVDLKRPSIQRAYLRMPSAAVFPQAGLLMSRHDIVLLADFRTWVDDNRITPGFVAFEDGMLTAKKSPLRPVRRIADPFSTSAISTRKTIRIGFSAAYLGSFEL
jgi:hypothetical protein